MLLYMKQLLVEVPDELAKELERVVPARSRKRSEFVRMAIRKALWELEEQATRAAYLRQPQDPNDAFLDPEVWAQEPYPRAITVRATSAASG